MERDNIMIQKEFNNTQKQTVLSIQKHKCKKCEKKFNISNLPEFGYIDGDVRNNAKTNIQALCINCFTQGKNQN